MGRPEFAAIFVFSLMVAMYAWGTFGIPKGYVHPDNPCGVFRYDYSYIDMSCVAANGYFNDRL